MVCVLLSAQGNTEIYVFSEATVFCDSTVWQLWQDKLQCVPAMCICSPQTGSTVPLKWESWHWLWIQHQTGLTLDVCSVV